MRAFFNKSLVLLIAATTALGCSTATDTAEDLAKKDGKLLQEHIVDISSQLKKIEDMNVIWTETIPHGRAVGATFVSADQTYFVQGEILFSEEGKPVISTIYSPTSEAGPDAFTLNSSSSQLKDGATIVSGFVHDPSIKQMEVVYVDGSSVIVPIDSNKAYHAVRPLPSSGVQKVYGLNQEAKRIYVAPPNPPQKIE
jgi:hypothetical protein